MSDELNEILSDTSKSMDKAINHLEAELVKIRAGKAQPTMLDGIMVDYYGNPTPVNQVANISVLDARTLSVQPWEKNMLQNIERGIIAANIGINLQTDGNIIRLFLPPLTEERRKELTHLKFLEKVFVLMDAPYRLKALLKDIKEIFEERRIFVAFNITMDDEKKFRGSAAAILNEIGEENLKGEFVIIVNKFNIKNDQHL